MDISTADYILYILVLITIIAFMYGAAHLIRRYAPGVNSSSIGSKKGRNRLNKIDSIPLDSSSRATLITCDETEYLVIHGTNGVHSTPHKSLQKSDFSPEPLDPAYKEANNSQ